MPLDGLFTHLDPEDREAALSILRADIARRRRRAASASKAEKTCPVCETSRPASDFNSDTTRGDGLDWRCRSCLSTYRRERRSE